MTLDELVARCKAGVSLEVNEHRNYYQSTEEYLTIHLDLGDVDIDLRSEMIAADTIYRLQFYPRTPVGFFVVYGLTLDSCLAQAAEILEWPT